MMRFSDGGTSRREVLKTMGAGVAFGLAAANHRAFAGVSPNDKILIGSIGVGNMGMGRLRGFMEHPDVAVAAICDVDQGRLDRALAEAEEHQGRKPLGFADFRKLLELKDLDAVVVATPDHWHGHRLTKAGLLGNIAFRLGRKLHWDDARERITGDSVADRMVKRRYRKPWKLP